LKSAEKIGAAEPGDPVSSFRQFRLTKSNAHLQQKQISKCFAKHPMNANRFLALTYSKKAG